MKRLLPVALFVGTLVPGAGFAQSQVMLEGVLDGGIRHDSGGTGPGGVTMGSGMRLPSRLTFSGIEDMGGGLKASFVLETGFLIDTGQGTANPAGAANGPLTFGRTSAVGVGGDDWGYLSLGRQYTPLWAVSAGGANDPFGASWLGGIGTLYSATPRASNSIVYSYGYSARTMLLPAPRKGLGVAVMYASPDTMAPAPSRAGQQLGFNVSYGDGTWWAGYGFHQTRGSNTDISATAPVTDQPRLRQQTLAASYEFSVARLHLGLNSAKNDTTVDRRNWHVGANIPFGVHVVKLVYGRANDRTAANADFSSFQVGYEYNLSRRTSLYAAYGQVDNNTNAAQILTGSQGTYAKGSMPRSYITGIKHTF
jgi:predicted porin